MKKEALISEFQPMWKIFSARDEINLKNEASVNIKNKTQKEIKWLPKCLEKTS